MYKIESAQDSQFLQYAIEEERKNGNGIIAIEELDCYSQAPYATKNKKPKEGELTISVIEAEELIQKWEQE